MPRRKKVSYEESTNQFWIECGIDIQNRRIMLDEAVEDYSIGWVIRAIQTMEMLDTSEPISLYINTYGGSCYDGLALYDAISQCKAMVYVYAIGKVMSMGTWILLAADKAYAYPHTTFMWHTVAGDKDYGKMFEHVTDTEEFKRLWNTLTDIYAKHTTKDKNWWKRWLKYEDRYDDVHRAKELGFIDEIIE